MLKAHKKTILALAAALAVFAAGILLPATGHGNAEKNAPRSVAFFLPPMIEGS